MADTFDVILFQSNTVEGKKIREKIKCEFDHVAMVLKFVSKPNEVFVLESVPDKGVSIRTWKDLRGLLGRDYSKIAFRHLIWDRPELNLNIVEQFVKETEGAAYRVEGIPKHEKRKSNFLSIFKKEEAQLVKKVSD